MFARMTILQVKLDSIEAAIKLFKSVVVPAAKKQKGFRGACLLSNREAGKGIVVTFWRTGRDALVNEENRYYQEQLIKFMSFFSGPPIREEYDVSVHAMEEPPRPKARAKKKSSARLT